MSDCPLPPAPTLAMTKRSLGAVKPFPPSTCLGKIIKDAAAMAVFLIKLLLEASAFSWITGFLAINLFFLIYKLYYTFHKGTSKNMFICHLILAPASDQLSLPGVRSAWTPSE